MALETFAEIARQRLRNQRLIGVPFATVDAAVAALGAVQSQDYAGAQWALAQRIRGGTEAALEAAFQSGRIVRTHVMRPTWHFVTPADIRWMLALTEPRVRKLLAYYDRQLEIDAELRRRCRSLFERALRDGRYLTRDELGETLASAGIVAMR